MLDHSIRPFPSLVVRARGERISMASPMDGTDVSMARGRTTIHAAGLHLESIGLGDYVGLLFRHSHTAPAVAAPKKKRSNDCEPYRQKCSLLNCPAIIPDGVISS